MKKKTRNIYKGRGQDLIKYLSTSMDEVTNWFDKYHVESIELSISGAMETGGIVKLIVSAKGEGGLRVTLKPKPKIKITAINAIKCYLHKCLKDSPSVY